MENEGLNEEQEKEFVELYKVVEPARRTFLKFITDGGPEKSLDRADLILQTLSLMVAELISLEQEHPYQTKKKFKDYLDEDVETMIERISKIKDANGYRRRET